MKTISSLLTVAEAATGQIETAMDGSITPALAADLQDRVSITIDLLNNMEAFLLAEAQTAADAQVLQASSNVERLFGT